MGARINLRYHLVLVSKYRRQAFSGIEGSVLEAIRQSSKSSAFKINSVAVEDGDHVHIVLRTTGTYSVSSMVARLKTLTARTLWEKHPEHLSKFYWGKKRKLWSSGYYCATLGDVSIEQIKKYLQKQGHWK